MCLSRAWLNWVVAVSNKDEDEGIARLERLNDDLKRSLRRCRDMLHDFEVRLTANSNEPNTAIDEQESGQADQA